TVMEATDLRNGDDCASCRWRHLPRDRRVLVEREMRAGSLVIFHVLCENTCEAGGSEDDHVIEALASDGSDEAFSVRVLPGRPRCREHVGDGHGLCSGAEAGEREIAVVQQVARQGIPRKGLSHLLSSPC